MSSEPHSKLDGLLTALIGKTLGMSGPWPAELHRYVTREAHARGVPADTFLERLPDHPSELAALIAAATVGHTGFFRHPEHFERLIAHAQRALEHTGTLRVWSLGCSTGEEAWSIALRLDQASIPFELWASDANPRAIEVARRGSYHVRSTHGLRRVTDQESWTAPDPLARRVRFDVAALHGPPPAEAPMRFDVLFCRNLLIYLAPAAVVEAWSMFLARTEPWAAIAVGPVESFNHVPPELTRVGPLGWFERSAREP